MPSLYRPLTGLFILPFSLALLANFINTSKVDKYDSRVILSVAFLFIYGLILSINYDFYAAVRQGAPLLVGLAIYLGFRYIFQNFNSNQILLYMNLSTVIFFPLVVIEFMSLAGIAPFSIKEFIADTFAGGNLVQRIQGTTHEASWLARISASLTPFNFIAMQRGLKLSKLALIFSVVIVIATLSLDGIVILFCGIAYLSYTKFGIKMTTFSIAALLCALILVSTIVSIYNQQQSNYYFLTRFEKLSNLSELSYENIAYNIDGSVFIRINYPLIGLEMFMEHPWGLGHSGYSNNFNQYIDKYYQNTPWIILEVENDIATSTGDPKSLFSRIAAELGILGIMVFFKIFHKTYIYCNKSSNKRTSFQFKLVLFTSLVASLQFASFAYAPLWFSLAFIKTYYKDQS